MPNSKLRPKKNKDQSKDCSFFTIEQQIIALANEHFLIRRCNIDSKSDPGKILTKLAKNEQLRPQGNGIYTLPQPQTFEDVAETMTVEMVLCGESALFFHLGLSEPKSPVQFSYRLSESFNAKENDFTFDPQKFVFVPLKSVDQNWNQIEIHKVGKSTLNCCSVERAVVETISVFMTHCQFPEISFLNTFRAIIELWKSGDISIHKVRLASQAINLSFYFEPIILFLDSIPRNRELVSKKSGKSSLLKTIS